MLTEVQTQVLDAVRAYDGIARYATVAYKLGMSINALRCVLEEIQASDTREVDVQFGSACVFVSAHRNA